jgi:hypothetical protein
MYVNLKAIIQTLSYTPELKVFILIKNIFWPEKSLFKSNLLIRRKF